MAKRDYIKEISEIRARGLKGKDRWEITNRRFLPLIDTFQHAFTIKNIDVKREVTRYIFVGLISCVEGYFREVIKSLIDSKENCRNNIEKIHDLKFDIKSVLAIHGKQVSMGEFVSHLIRLSSYEEINKAMSIIMDTDFAEEIKKASRIRSGEEVTIMSDDCIEYVKKTFEYRNIYCHELASRKEPHKKLFTMAILCLRAVNDFTIATEHYILKYLST